MCIKNVYNTRASAFYIPTTLHYFYYYYMLRSTTYYILDIYEYYNFSIVFFDDIFSASESFLAISNC